MKHKAFISYGLRTAISRATKGSLAMVRPDDFCADVVKALLSHYEVGGEHVDDVILGCATPEAEQGVNVARRVAMLAGLPSSVPGGTVSRYCGSSLDAVAISLLRVEAEWADLIIAGGVESMSMAPMGGLQPSKTENPKLAPMRRKMPAAIPLVQTAQYIAEVHNISREEQDRFAFASHQKAIAAIENCLFEEEIVPIRHRSFTGKIKEFKIDECPRRNVTMEKLASLPTISRPVTGSEKKPTVTAGNSCPLNDGAAAMFVGSEKKLEELGLKPKAVLRSLVVAGVEPHEMGIGPVPATRKALERAGVKIKDIDLIEMNEAFASQCIYGIKELDFNPDIVNVNGGAIALGHPLGATGAMLVIKILKELERRGKKLGLITMCVADGQGITAILERVE